MRPSAARGRCLRTARPRSRPGQPAPGSLRRWAAPSRAAGWRARGAGVLSAEGLVGDRADQGHERNARRCRSHKGLPADEAAAVPLVLTLVAVALPEVDPRAAPRLRPRAEPVALLALRVGLVRPRCEVFILTGALAPDPAASPAAADVRLTVCDPEDARLVEGRNDRPGWLGEWPAPGEPSPATRRGPPVEPGRCRRGGPAEGPRAGVADREPARSGERAGADARLGAGPRRMRAACSCTPRVPGADVPPAAAGAVTATAGAGAPRGCASGAAGRAGPVPLTRA